MSVVQAQQQQRTEAAFRKAEIEGIALATRVKLIALALIAVWLVATAPSLRTSYYLGILIVFASVTISLYAYSRTRAYRPWVKYAAAAFDCLLLGAALFAPNPLWRDPFPPQMVLRDPSLIFFFVLVAAHALSYSPRLMLWTAAIAAVVWSGSVAWLAGMPDTLGWLSAVQGRELPQAERVSYILDPRFVDLGARAAELIVFLVASGALALVVRRSQHLVAKQVWLERARTNLARYFSPNLVDELCASENPLGQVRQQEVAVLFADVSGFTRLCEGTAPDEVVDLLRGFFRRAERVLFTHGGTLDKYIGDCVMATFGVPKSNGQHAADAVACARSLLLALDEWNFERGRTGRPPVRVGIGIHCGRVIVGEVGGDQRREFSVIGDAVNVASRLEALTRSLSAEIVISREVADAAAAQGGAYALEGFVALQPQQLKGREMAISVLIFRAPSSLASSGQAEVQGMPASPPGASAAGEREGPVAVFDLTLSASR